MKKDIHPKYQDILFTCACGASYKAGSTIQKDFKTEICSACHPFFTGKQKLIDSSGCVDKFIARREAAKTAKEKAKIQKEEKKQKKTVKVKKKSKAKK